MIVYGDPSYEATLASLSERIRSFYRSLPSTPSIDDLRTLLIEAGQAEQAAEDFSPDAAAPYRALTDALAELFLRTGEPLPRPHEKGALAAPEQTPDVRVTVKTPEGFAFYGLYPEAYAVAAEQWRADHPGTRVAVVGIRSIGTTLSAVVLAALRARRVRAYRLTVRPTGHPFAREAVLPPLDADWVLIVDEGPGLSGSSMASVAEAAYRSGIARERIAFFPGHGGEPGAQASEEVRRWWASTPRFAMPAEELRWDGLALEEILAEATGNVLSVQELSGGAWRERVFADPAEWPGVAMPFERRKILVTQTGGSKVLWKFTGLQEGRSTLGFMATPWLEGRPLRREDATPELLAQIGRHIASVAAPPLSKQEEAAAGKRLEDVLYWNTLESPGPTVKLSAPEVGALPSFGDGRLAPYEWRQITDGAIAKVPRIASTLDHTIVGQQPIAWDIAGAIVEWDLDEEAQDALLANAPAVSPEALRFYRLAYAGFRMGMCAMCAGMCDDSEAKRLRRDETFYQTAISRLV